MEHSIPSQSNSQQLRGSNTGHSLQIGVPAAASSGAVAGTSSPGGVTRITSPPQIANFGIDTVYISFNVAFDSPAGIFPVLAEQKAWLQSGGNSEDEIHVKLCESDLFSFNLQRTGAKQYPFILRSGDITLKLSPRSHILSAPNVSLEVGSISSQEGLAETVEQFKLWLNYIGGTVVAEKVSRIDLAADLKVSFADTGLDDYDRHISRSSKLQLHVSDRNLTGVTVGRGNIVMRAYDKILEMQEKQAYVKQTFFRMLWGGEQKEITRVEYQLRRETIKEMFPEDSRFETVLGRISEIWEYLTTDWFRQTEEKVDRKNNHQSRCEVSSFWLIVQSASGYRPAPITRRRDRVHINIPALRKMISGCLLTVAAGMGHAVDDFFGIMGTGRDIIEGELKDLLETATFKKKFAVRQTAAYVSF